jgi:hypothetical protein
MFLDLSVFTATNIRYCGISQEQRWLTGSTVLWHFTGATVTQRQYKMNDQNKCCICVYVSRMAEKKLWLATERFYTGNIIRNKSPQNKVNISIISAVTLCSLVERYHHFIRSGGHHHQGTAGSHSRKNGESFTEERQTLGSRVNGELQLLLQVEGTQNIQYQEREENK